MTASTFTQISYDWQLNLTPPKQEAKNSAFPDPRALGVQLGSFWVSLNCPNSHLDSQEVLLVSTYTVLCVSEEIRTTKFFMLGLR